MGGCKYCQIGEPLVQLGKNTTVRIEGGDLEGIWLVVESCGTKTRKAIDYCPVCGEQYRPFGPA